MQLADLPAVARIQALAYPAGFIEDDATLRERLLAHPDTAWVACAAGQAAAYLVAYRSVLGKITPLAAPFAPSAQANCLYLHDLAVHPAYSGQGLGPRLVRHALQVGARGMAWSALVSVQASQPFWQALGYQNHPLTGAAQRQNLATYPGQGVYMAQSLMPVLAI